MALSSSPNTINSGLRAALLTLLTVSGCLIEVPTILSPDDEVGDTGSGDSTDEGSSESSGDTSSTTGDESSESGEDTSSSTTGDESSESGEDTADESSTGSEGSSESGGDNTGEGSDTGALLCTIAEGRNDCMNCLATSCVAESDNCATNQNCCDYVNCVLDPNNFLTICETQYAENMKVIPLADCIDLHCAEECE